MDPLRIQLHPHYPAPLRGKLEDWNRRYDAVNAERLETIGAAREAVYLLTTGQTDPVDLPIPEDCRVALLKLDSHELALMLERETFSTAVYEADSERSEALHELAADREAALRKKHDGIPEDALRLIVEQDSEHQSIHREARRLAGQDTHRRNFSTAANGDEHPARTRAAELRADIAARARKLFGVPGGR